VNRSAKTRRTAAALASVAVLGLSACGGGDGSGSGDDGGDVSTLALWDGFTQYDESSPYGQLVSSCETEVGVTVERTQDAAVGDKLLQAASSGETPDLVILDNPTVAQFADSGILVDNETSGLDASAQDENILAAGQVDGKTYGGSIGSNTLALFYNVDMLAAAGVAPPTNWEELRAAVAATTSGDVKGMAFSAINTEEGSFQFEPFFWGAGAELSELDSPEAVEALQLWTDWVESGQASESNLNANQQDVRDQFLAGTAAMMVNGTWQLPDLNTSGINYAVVPLPAVDGGSAPSPLGGEFIEVVVSDDARQQKAAEFAQCFIDPANLSAWATGQSYILPYAEQAQEQAAADPALEPWVEAISVARGRTADLGAEYPDVSQALWTAVQESLSGTKTPQQALTDAQASVGS
jgi:multiple sugar transport system substrate-binding protein